MYFAINYISWKFHGRNISTHVLKWNDKSLTNFTIICSPEYLKASISKWIDIHVSKINITMWKKNIIIKLVVLILCTIRYNVHPGHLRLLKQYLKKRKATESIFYLIYLVKLCKKSPEVAIGFLGRLRY